VDLQTAVLLTEENLWPTPTVNGNHNRKGVSKNSGDGLETAVLRENGKLWPTPDTRGFTNKGSLKMRVEKTENPEEFKGMVYRANTKKKEKLWGTPTANDAKNSLTGSQAGRGTLTAQIVESLRPTPRTAGRCGGTGNWEQLKRCAPA
jgi:hypothetical protein